MGGVERLGLKLDESGKVKLIPHMKKVKILK